MLSSISMGAQTKNNDMNYHQILENIYMDIRPYAQVDKQADYIPALASVDPDQFGICINTLQGDENNERLGFTQLGKIPQGFRMKDGHYEDVIPHYILLK